MSERGFLLGAVGERQNRDAALAIGGLRARGHDVPVALLTDGTGRGAGADIVERIEAEPYGCRNLPALLPRSPFAETVFIAHDMMAVGRLDPVFAVLAGYDLAMAHAADRAGALDAAVPEAFYPFDLGIIAYRKTPAVVACFAGWHAALVEGAEHDPDDALFHDGRAALRRAVWRQRMGVAVLPPEYCYRAGLPGFLRDKAVLVHAAGRAAGELVRTLNRGSGPRSFTAFAGAPAGEFAGPAAGAFPLGGFATAGDSAAFGRIG